MKMTITNTDIIGFQSHLLDMGRSPATIQKYLRDVTAFAIWLGDRPITKENTMAWKTQLVASNDRYRLARRRCEALCLCVFLPTVRADPCQLSKHLLITPARVCSIVPSQTGCPPYFFPRVFGALFFALEGVSARFLAASTFFTALRYTSAHSKKPAFKVNTSALLNTQSMISSIVLGRYP